MLALPVTVAQPTRWPGNSQNDLPAFALQHGAQLRASRIPHRKNISV